MVNKKRASGSENDETIGSTGVNIDFGKLYSFSPDEINLDIEKVAYSNLAYISCTPRDVFIDFLEMPGVKTDGKTVVKGTRVYMSHAAAQKCALALQNILEKVDHEGSMEKYQPK